MLPSVTMNTGPFTLAVQSLAGRDLRVAMCWALDDMATDIVEGVTHRMNVVFDKPTRFTQNAFHTVKAQVGKLEARVQQKSGASARHYLQIQEEGGYRPMTGLERRISSKLAYEGIIQSIIPADNARLDAHGNWSRGQVTQVMSDLGVQGDKWANSTAKSRKRAKDRGRYFVPKSGLSPGIYHRDMSGKIGIVAAISQSEPFYQPRLGFYEEANRLFQVRMAEHLERTFKQMLAKRFG
jgi:hypothetical protein